MILVIEARSVSWASEKLAVSPTTIIGRTFVSDAVKVDIGLRLDAVAGSGENLTVVGPKSPRVAVGRVSISVGFYAFKVFVNESKIFLNPSGAGVPSPDLVESPSRNWE
ncbi:hypothetical protein FQN51_008600 [Onygenales sp. PD_10]|nr:hypothetical protein FQN51_008600 [Onygenales sp. PD_10]